MSVFPEFSHEAREPAQASDATTIVGQLVETLDPGSVITSFVVIAEIIDPDGDRAVWTSVPETATKWATIGLLTYALEREKQIHEDDSEGDW